MSLTVRTVSVTPLRQNCTILSRDGHAVVVDPGGDVSALLAATRDLHVEAILLTHGHLDHAGGAAALKRALVERQGGTVEILGPDERDAPILASIERHAAEFGMTGMYNVTPDRYLTGGTTLHLLGHVLEVAHVPGHTPGHIVFIDRADGRAIVGDTLFRGTVGRTDFPYGDADALLDAINRELLTLPDHTVVLCGHGLPTTIGEERRSNPFFQSRS